ncbi:MAG: YfhO family protein [Chitinophagaceae bacterium]|nr:YfhO family protein [Anaerolineae bacterium]
MAWLGNRDSYSSVIGAAGFSTMIAMLIITIFAQFRSSRTGLLLLAGLIVFDLFSVNIDNGNFQPAVTNPLSTTPLIAQLQTDHEIPFRVDGDNSGLLGNAGSLYQLPDIRGISPLFLDSAHAIIERELPSERDWELFAIRYVFSRADSLPSPSEIIGSENDQGGTLYLHRLNNPRPFALLIYDFDIADSDALARALLADPAYDPRTSVILNREPSIDLPDSPAEMTEAEIIVFAPEHLTVEVNTSENALLSLSQLDYPGWKATLNSQPVDILRAYGAFTALEIPSGQHTIMLTYDPISYKLGAVLSLFTWTAVIILGAIALFWRILRR